MAKIKKPSALEALLAFQLKALRIPYAEEYRFAALATGGTGAGVRVRLSEAGLKDWRFDFCFPELMIAVECEGGGWSGGRHTRGAGFHDDMLKYDYAMRLGWCVYRCDLSMIQGGQALNTIEVLINAKKR